MPQCRDKNKNKQKVVSLLYRGQIFKMVRFRIELTARPISLCIMLSLSNFISIFPLLEIVIFLYKVIGM